MMTEDEFFAGLFRRLPAFPAAVVIPPGDDCAAVAWGDGRLLLLAVDQVVGDRHYVSRGEQATPPRLAGRKLLARNLSDIAAMGGRPTLCLLAGAFAKDRDDAWLRDFYDGIIALAAEYGVSMVGGDFAATPHDDVASLTILGEVAADQVVRRSGARPGDRLYATGCFGDSFASQHHLLFAPRCAEGQWLAQQRLARAMMDVSDGLLRDAARICMASGVGLTLDLEAVPRRGAATLEQACGDGEDFELIFAVPPELAATLAAGWPFADTPLTCLGEFTGATGLRDSSGQPLKVAGWDHFAV
ncbi:MAG: thiamine-phosphate kinase [Lentisphaeria bacterium]|jgi:thiamine-monophosphate kinase|nr:thiamine-phosphate kinase [Lentisphaeria bacterium]